MLLGNFTYSVNEPPIQSFPVYVCTSVLLFCLYTSVTVHIFSFRVFVTKVFVLCLNILKTTVTQLLYHSSCVARHAKLKTGRFFSAIFASFMLLLMASSILRLWLSFSKSTELHGRLKTWEWKTQHHQKCTEVENAGLEKMAPDNMGGKCGSRQNRNV